MRSFIKGAVSFRLKKLSEICSLACVMDVFLLSTIALRNAGKWHHYKVFLCNK